jgi:hypothetical protein
MKAIEKDLEPGAEIHRVDIDRDAHVAQIARAIACGDVHAAANRDGEMSKFAAGGDLPSHCVHGLRLYCPSARTD